MADGWASGLVCGLSEELGPSAELEKFLGTAQVMLADVIPCEVIWHTELDFSTCDSRVFGLADSRAQAARTASLLPINPIIREFFHRPPGAQAWVIGDADPRGTGSSPNAVAVAPPPLLELTRSIFAERHTDRLGPKGPKAHMGIFTTDAAAYTSQRARGWGFVRSANRFNASEMELAAKLQPVLTILETVYQRPPSPHSGTPEELDADPRDPPEAAVRCPLTEREVEIVRLTCRGLTAVHIGHVLRISHLTVRKHLQNIYAKLGVHDRLLLVERARRLGLLEVQ